MNPRDEFVRANLRLVVTMARRYDRGGMPLADLMQEGNLGLCAPWSGYDYRRGLRLRHLCELVDPPRDQPRALSDNGPRACAMPGAHAIEAQQQREKRCTNAGE